jgi:3-deoxy-D-manno-octulosonic-acid transferase
MDDPFLQAQDKRILFRLMHLLYNISIGLYGFLICFTSLFNAKAKLWIAGRNKWKSTLPKNETKKDVYWFHCASLGEFDQGLPVMNALKNKFPDAFILVTFFSPSGMLHYHKRTHLADHVMYLPLDTVSNSAYFLDAIKPVKIYFIKYEFWANYLLQAKKRGIDVYSVSSNFRKSQIFFKWYGGFFQKIIRQINHFYVQTEESKSLLNSIGIEDVTVVGDTRFDQVVQVKNQVLDKKIRGKFDADFSKIEKFLNGQAAIVLGSSWPVEEDKLIPFILNHPSLKFIVAPHDISVGHINSIVNKLQSNGIRFTHYNGEDVQANCLILDTIGHLSKAYVFGKIAVVGGGFTGKLHNILEPASYGLPVLFGPKHDKFPEAQMFIGKGLAFEFKTESDVEIKLKELLLTADTYHFKMQDTIKSLLGASNRIIELSTRLMDK